MGKLNDSESLTRTREASLSTEYFERAKKVTPGGVHSPVRAFRGVGGVPPFIHSARGIRLRDVDGNEYTDYCLSWGPMIFGHRDPDIEKAVLSACQRGSSFGAAEPYSLEMAELLVRELPFLQKVRFVNSGTEAVMSALRVARGATRRDKIIKFEGCYHGHADSMLVRAGSGLAEMASPDSAGVPAGCASDTIVAPLDDLEVVEAIFSHHKGEIAAVIIEPLPANNGLLVQRPEFLRGLRKLTREHGSLLILDEVISGFRVAFGGMAEHIGIEPDLVTYGKIIGGGFPVGAYGGKAEYMDYVAPIGAVYQAGTLSANPVAIAAGHTALRKLLETRPYKQMETIAQDLTDRTRKVFSRFETLLTVQQFGSLFWICKTVPGYEVIRKQSDISAEQNQLFPNIFHGLLDRGIYLAPSAYEVGFISSLHDKNTNDEFVSKLENVLAEITAKDVNAPEVR